MSESENKYQYRSYTAEEISRLLDISDASEKTSIKIYLANTKGSLH